MIIPPNSPTYLKPKEEVVTTRITYEEAQKKDEYIFFNISNLTKEQLQERIKEQESKTAAVVLEVVGDIADAELKPPDNVLFMY